MDRGLTSGWMGENIRGRGYEITWMDLVCIDGQTGAFMKANTRRIRGRGWELSRGLTGDSTSGSGQRGKCTEKECS